MRSVLCVVSLGFFLSGCSGFGDGEPEPTPTMRMVGAAALSSTPTPGPLTSAATGSVKSTLGLGHYVDDDFGYSFNHPENYVVVPSWPDRLFPTEGFLDETQLTVKFPTFNGVPRPLWDGYYDTNDVLIHVFDFDEDVTEEIEGELPAMRLLTDWLVDEVDTFDWESGRIIPAFVSEPMRVDLKQLVGYSFDYSGGRRAIPDVDVRGRVYYLLSSERLYRIICEYEASRFDRSIVGCETIVTTLRIR